VRRLGAALVADSGVFAGRGRPGGLVDALAAPLQPRGRAPLAAGSAPGSAGKDVTAERLLGALLAGLSSIWPAGNALDGVPLGDAWRHPHAGGEGDTAGWVPFHKLSQWLAYSLLEPFAWAGVPVAGQEALTALPEYRNGGLLLDTGVVALRDPALARTPHAVGSELVVEWRALTVALVDELAPLVRRELARPDLPLACILEGGTWAAGREFAARLRGGEPPLTIASDGTVF
jgi:hypothetical protein